MKMPAKTIVSRRGRGFTLIELLTVVTIVAILAALTFPALRSARVAAKKARTKVQFSQWAAACESFRSEYGFYPVFHASQLVNPPAQNTEPSSLHLFHDLLAGRRRDGSALPSMDASASPLFPERQNRKRIVFHAFSAAELRDDQLICDSFGNADIAVLTDRNLDGRIDPADYGGALPSVGGLRPGPADFPAGGVRAGVVFYAPAPGADASAPEFICSWK